MNLLARKRQKHIRRKLLINFGLVLLLCYFILNFIFGSRGIISFFAISDEIKATNEKIEDLIEKQFISERQTSLLRQGNIDEDLIDELSRGISNLSGSKEEIIYKKAN